MEDYKIKVAGRSIHVVGKQKVETMGTLPHVLLTYYYDWDQGILDHVHPAKWPQKLVF